MGPLLVADLLLTFSPPARAENPRIDAFRGEEHRALNMEVLLSCVVADQACSLSQDFLERLLAAGYDVAPLRGDR